MAPSARPKNPPSPTTTRAAQAAGAGIVLPGTIAALGAAGGVRTQTVVATAALRSTEELRAAILAALLQAIDVLALRLRAKVDATILERYPEEQRSAIAQAEEVFAAEYRRRAEERVSLGLRTALSLPTSEEEAERLQRELQAEERKRAPDAEKMEALRREIRWVRTRPGPRERAVRGILRREEQYASQHSAASFARSVAWAERSRLRRESPLGAYWKMDPFVKEHTAGCLIMGEKFWPWIVLDRVHPPRHPACPCRLVSYGQAIKNGWLKPGVMMPEREAVRLAEPVLMESEVDLLLTLLELESRGVESAALALGR